MKSKLISLAKGLHPRHLLKKWWAIKGFKKWFLAFLVFVVLFMAARQILSVINRDKPDLRRYQIVKVEKQDITKTITKEGILRFVGVVDYPAPTSGVITGIWAQNGDAVKKGQNILSLQSTASKEDQLAALSQYLTAKTALENAKIAKEQSQLSLEAARQGVLEASQVRQNMENRFADGNYLNPSANRPDQSYTDSEIEAIKSAETQARSGFATAEKQYINADAHIAAAAAALNLSVWRYQLTKDTIITAPADGRLVNLNFMKGETVNAQDSPLFRIISAHDLMITLRASEAEVLQFNVGQAAEFKTAVYPDLKFKGQVVAVDTIGTEIKSDTGSVTEYIVKIKPEATDKKFLSPMTVDTDTVVQNKSAVLVVPNAAVNYGGGKRTVTLVKNGRTENREVILGIISDGGTEIVSGLSEGDEILVPQASKL